MFFLSSLACSGNETEALLDIYNTNGGDMWKNAVLWGSENHCAWEGVTCNRGGFVIELNLAGQGLLGALSSSIECLPFLKSFNLNENHLSTLLDSSFCSLVNLQYFQASNAGLTVGIPSCVC
jgi:hypothetical protein